MRNNLPTLSVDHLVLSEKIQNTLLPILVNYLDDKPAIIDALDWILRVIVNDEKNDLNVYKNLYDFNKAKAEQEREKGEIEELYYSFYPKTVFPREEELIKSGYICRSCAMKLGAIPVEDHVCTYHFCICEFCGEEQNLCHTSDWSWPDARYLEEGREF